MWPFDYRYSAVGPWYSFVSPFIWVFSIFVFVFIIIRIFHPHRHHGFMNETPLDILKKRYAKGEITKKEFNEMREHISS